MIAAKIKNGVIACDARKLGDNLRRIERALPKCIIKLEPINRGYKVCNCVCSAAKDERIAPAAAVQHIVPVTTI